MPKRIITILLVLLSAACQEKSGGPQNSGNILPELSIDTSAKQLMIAEQSGSCVKIFDQPTRVLLWSWSAQGCDAISSKHKYAFNLPSEVKPVLGASCVLLTASGDGAALVRIKDSKLLFYALPGKNPHSAEILPDGRIVTASSSGSYLKVFDVDTTAVFSSKAIFSTEFYDAHGVLWDKKRSRLWALGGSDLAWYSYSSEDGSLTKEGSLGLPSLYGHDLIAVYGKDEIMISTGSEVYYFDPSKMTFKAVEGAPTVKSIKSLSTGPEGFPVICTYPQQSWYTTQATGFFTGLKTFYLADSQIYKARWRVDNPFSY